MQLGIESQIPEGLLAANALLAENSRQGVPTSTHTLHRGFQFAISSTYKGFQFRCYESASDPVVAPNNATQPNQKNCGQILKSAAVTVGLDAAGTFLGAIPGAGAGLVTAQVVVGLAGAANSAYHGDIGGTMAGTIGGAQLSAVAAGAEQVGWTSLKTFGGTAARALPWIGSAVSAYYFYKDATEALDKYQACKAGIGG